MEDLDRLRIMTLNIGSLFESNWDARRHEVVAWVDRCQPDVICLQEVWEADESTNTAGWVAEAASVDWHWVFGGYPFAPFDRRLPGFRYGSAVLSRWPIVDHQVHRLPYLPDTDDELVARMPWELVHARTAGLDVFTAHLAPAPIHGLHRRLQVVAIADIIDAARHDLDRIRADRTRTPMAPILCGDFNAEPSSDEIRFLRGHTPIDGRMAFFQDAWAVAGDHDAGFTQDWSTHPLAAELNVHRKRIDYVFVGDPFLRNGGGSRVLACHRMADQPITGVQASDHCGVVADVRWPDRPSASGIPV